ncbi:(2,3-dihydroxybenzoyl)adenylate synthase [Romboutsia lituseburensis]|uniref:(2,3-dihydroxybenzoyl)adenylate synthase n=1 Tax=Romboutsia lituseburensis TaxID=1537 RepID=UPI00215A9FBF|nr:AMP-binding protein [Romboutsia lituseburensis]MCR8746646.1 AMP-binding protein [Romboutsia lituseburensis]
MNKHIINELEDKYDKLAWEKNTLSQALVDWEKKYSDKVAIVDDEKEFTYNKLLKDVNNYAAGLIKYGFEKGDKIVLQIPNSYEFVALSFAMFKIGVIPIMALPAHREIELKGIIKKSQAKAYIINNKYLGYDFLKLAKGLIDQLTNTLDVFVIGDCGKFKSIDILNDKNNIDEIKCNIDYKEIALLLLSGGTTGIPKLIPRRHTDYLYVAKKMAQKCKMNSDTVYLASLPISHNFPLGCPGLVGTLSVGGKVVMCKTTSPDEILPLIEEQRVSITGLVPAMAVMCADFIKDYDDYNLESLKVLQVGGSVLDSKTAKNISNTFGCKLQQIFGIAEGLICCTSLDDEDEIIYNCQGTPISDMDEVLIVDEDENEVEAENYGELIVRGPYTIHGYYNLEEVNKKCINKNGFFKTGDKARVLKNGNYQIAGRIKEMINRAGEKITPFELEDILLKNNYIKNVQVVGIKDNFLGERICVFILKDNNKELSLEEVRMFLVEKGVATFKLPDQILYVEDWPLTSVGKISKNKLKEIALENNLVEEVL